MVIVGIGLVLIMVNSDGKCASASGIGGHEFGGCTAAVAIATTTVRTEDRTTAEAVGQRL